MFINLKYVAAIFLLILGPLSVPVFAQPTLTFSPTNGSSAILETSTITISSNQSLRRDSDNAGLDNTNVASVLTVKLTNSSGADIPFTATINAGDDVITITPSASLPSAQTIYVAIGNVESVGVGGGSLTPDPTAITFTIRDYEPPTITFAPSNGTSNVSIGSNITLTFSEPIQNIDNSAIINANVASLLTLKTTDAAGADVPFTATINAGKTVITIDPTSNLTNNQLYYIAIAPVEDAGGSATSASNSTFTTTNDTQAPVATFNPLNGSVDVVNASPLTITFDEPIRDLNDGTLVNSNIDGKITLKLNNATGADIPFDATINAGKTVITITPSSTLPDFSVIYLAINDVEDAFDNAIATQSTMFTTGDGTPPGITFNPGNNATGVAVNSNIIISFSEAIRNIDDSDITNGTVASLINLKLTNSAGANVPFAASINGGRTQITINPSSNLNTDQLYYVSFAPVENSYNVATVLSSITFMTIDTQVPTVTFSPVNGATGVNNSVNIVITFNEPIRNLNDAALDNTSVDSKITLKLTNAAGADIAFDATIDAGKTQITIDPVLPLPDVALIYVAVNNVEDGSNNQIITPQSSTFTTVDGTPPAITTNPANGSTSFSITGDITISFNEPVRRINDTDITDATVDALIELKLTNSSGAAVPFDATIDAGKMLITINPTTNLLADQLYYLSFAPVEDAANNATAFTAITFQTQQLTADAGADQIICAGQTTTLNGAATGGTGFYSFQWSGPNGFTSTQTNPQITPTTLGANVYTLVVTDSNSPTGNTDSETVTITVNAAPTALEFIPTGTDVSVRQQFDAQEPPYELAASGTPAGGTYSFAGLGVSLFPDGKYYFQPQVAGINNNPITITGTYTYNGCTISENLIVNVASGIVNGLEPEYCSGTGLTAILSHNPGTIGVGLTYTRIRLYQFGMGYIDDFDPNAGLILVDQGTNPKTYRINTDLITPSGYFVDVFVTDGTSEYLWVYGRTMINAAPAAPTYDFLKPYCVSDVISGERVALFSAGTVKWYQNSSLSTEINGIADVNKPTFSELTIPENSAGVFSKYATQTDGRGCESEALMVQVIVNANPSQPTISDPPPVCSGQPLPDLVASGSIMATQYRWYGSAGLNTYDPNTIYTPNTNSTNPEKLLVPNTVTSTTTYQRFVSQFVNGCESQVAKVDIVIKQTPIAPLAASPTYCLNETIAPIQITTSGSVSVRWYSDEALTSQITPIANPENATANELGLTSTSPNVAFRYVTQTLDNCQSAPRTVVVTVNGLPGVSIKSNQDLSAICKSSAEINLIADPPNPQNGGGWSGNAAPGFTSVDLQAGTATLSPAAGLFLPGQSYTLTYTYIDENTTCQNSVTETLTFLPSINPSVSVGDACFNSFVNLENTSTIVPNGASSTIASYGWSFGDNDVLESGSGPIADGTHGGNTTGTYQNLQHRFRDLKDYTVRYVMTTSDGCVVEAQRDVEIHPIPAVNFTWANACLGGETQFTATVNNIGGDANIQSIVWDFATEGNLDVTTAGTGKIAETVYGSLGRDSVNLTITSIYNCASSKKKPVYIVPVFGAVTENNLYSEDFESGSGGWIDGGALSSWQHGTPAATVINRDSSQAGTGSAWATNLTGFANLNEQSWVMSPCFDLTEVAKPVISLDFWSDTPERIDGAVLQWHESGDILNDANWHVLGEVGGGLNWYNENGISSKPGNQTSGDAGWTGDRNTGYKHAVYRLDALKGKSSIRFRIAFASKVGGRDGFAFDNVFVGERSRIVLVENFTNSSQLADAKTHNEFFNGFEEPSSGDPTEIVKIQYHTSFPGNDAVHDLNRSIHDARTAFYGISQSPTVRIDGQYKSGGASSWLEPTYDNRVLEPALLKITFDKVEKVGDIIELDVTVKNTTNLQIDATSLRLFAVVLEKSVTQSGLLGDGGNEEFRYVAKDFLPSPAGLPFAGPLAAQGEETFHLEWSKQQLIDPSQALIAVFVQTISGAREVYQAKLYSGPPVPSLVTGLPLDITEHVKIYPNPSDQILTIVLPEAARKTTMVTMNDSFGRMVLSSSVEKGDTRIDITTKDLAGGMYFIQLENDKEFVRQKIMVIHR